MFCVEWYLISVAASSTTLTLTVGRTLHHVAVAFLQLMGLEYAVHFKVHPSIVRDLGVQLDKIAVVLQLVGRSPEVWQGGYVFEYHSHRDDLVRMFKAIEVKT